jgi:hypothetical protein
MNGVVIALGLIVLVGLSTAAGMVTAGERLHRQRLRLDSLSWQLWHWEQELLNAADYRDCPSCRLLRHRAELQRSPTPGHEAA